MSQKKPDEQKPIKIMAVVCAALIAIAGIFVFAPDSADSVYEFFTGQKRSTAAQFAKPAADPAAENGVPDVPDGLEWPIAPAFAEMLLLRTVLPTFI